MKLFVWYENYAYSFIVKVVWTLEKIVWNLIYERCNLNFICICPYIHPMKSLWEEAHIWNISMKLFHDLEWCWFMKRYHFHGVINYHRHNNHIFEFWTLFQHEITTVMKVLLWRFKLHNLRNWCFSKIWNKMKLVINYHKGNWLTLLWKWKIIFSWYCSKDFNVWCFKNYRQKDVYDIVSY